MPPVKSESDLEIVYVDGTVELKQPPGSVPLPPPHVPRYGTRSFIAGSLGAGVVLALHDVARMLF